MKEQPIRPDRALFGLFEHMYRRASEQECEKLLKQLEGQCSPSEAGKYAEACALMARIQELKDKRTAPRTYTTPKKPQNTTQGVVAYVYDGHLYEKQVFERMINNWKKPKKEEKIVVQDYILA